MYKLSGQGNKTSNHGNIRLHKGMLEGLQKEVGPLGNLMPRTKCVYMKKRP